MSTFFLLGALAVAQESPDADPTPRAPSFAESRAFTPRPFTPRPRLRLGPVASDTTEAMLPAGAPSIAAAPPRRRSRNLLLGALCAEVAAGALLGGAALTRDMYLDPAEEPGVDLYRANRILGHAGYASAVAGGALALGGLSKWEW